MDFSSASISILEDSDSDFLVLQKMLLDLGFSSSSIFRCAALADYTYRNERFILCDLNLLDSFGLDTLKAVMSRIPEVGPSVIAFTGEDDEALAQEAIHLGVQDYLIKGSFSRGFLRKTLVFAYERSRLVRDLLLQERKTRDVEQTLEAIFNTVPSIIVRFDSNYCIEYVNRGLDPQAPLDTIIGSYLFDYIAIEERTMLDVLMGELQAGAPMVSYQTVATDSHGNAKEMLFRVSMLDDRSFVLIATDVSDLMHARRLQEKETRQGKKFQLQLLGSQLNPHFVFNAMSAIQHAVLLNSIEDTLSFISTFSTLMRQVLENSRKELITWREERAFLTTFLEVERFRYEGKFDYAFDVDGKVDPDAFNLPPMLLQPYLENTVVHGVGNLKDRQGRVLIKVRCSENGVWVIIEDNGVGRDKAKVLRSLRVSSDHASRAMDINAERLTLLNDVYRTDEFQVILTDLKDEASQALGTKVEIYIPSHLLV
jgi:CheY-like chemotaxis protein